MGSVEPTRKEEPVVNQCTTYVGMDVHKKDIVVAMLSPGAEKPEEWKLPNEPRAVRRLAKRLLKGVEDDAPILCVYEAGPCGYVLQRQLMQLGIETEVVAPSLIPIKPGERVKTDRRDARKLAFAARAGTLTMVRPPTEADEAVRDLCRAREATVGDLTRARHRLTKMLLRRGFVYREGRNWTLGHRQWLRGLRFEDLPTQTVFEDNLLAIEQIEERKRHLESRLEEISKAEPYTELVGWLRCFRGIDTVTAMTILAELHDFRRFEDPRQLMAYLGLVPSEHSSGERTHRGPITKTGNAHVRAVIVEAAWHYRHRPAVGAKLRKRREGQPQEICALADKAQRRLNQKFHRLVLGSGKPPNKAVVAIARELAGFLWAALYQYPMQKHAGMMH